MCRADGTDERRASCSSLDSIVSKLHLSLTAMALPLTLDPSESMRGVSVSYFPGFPRAAYSPAWTHRFRCQAVAGNVGGLESRITFCNLLMGFSGSFLISV